MSSTDRDGADQARLARPRIVLSATASFARTNSTSRTKVLAVAALATAACGVIAYVKGGLGGFDALYNTLLLFTATYTPPPSARHTSALLQIARFAALAIAFAAVASALLALFRDQADALAARRIKRHVVVCGLGDLGTRLALLLRGAGHGVVAVAPQLDRVTADRLRREGVRIVAGDPQDREVLKRAGTDRAYHLVALDETDDVNAAIAAAAVTSREEGARAPLACLAHIRDLALSERLRGMALREGRAAPMVTIDFVNADENAARELIAASGQRLWQPGPLHLMIIEPSRFGVALLLQLARTRTAAHGTANMALSVVGLESPRWCTETMDTWQELVAVAPVITYTEEPTQRALASIGATAEARIGRSVDYAAVCGTDPDRALLLALALTDHLQGVQIAVQADGGAGLAHTIARQAPMLQLVDTTASLLRPEILLADVYVMLARASHEEYLKRQLTLGGEVMFARPSLRPWDQLSRSLKSSNIDQARFMVENLRLTGYDIQRPGGVSAVVTFDTDTVELLAAREHERWLREYRRTHMRPDHNVSALTDSDLVPWESLPEHRRELDRDVVRSYPTQAARVGYCIVPVNGASSMPSPPSHP